MSSISTNRKDVIKKLTIEFILPNKPSIKANFMLKNVYPNKRFVTYEQRDGEVHASTITLVNINDIKAYIIVDDQPLKNHVNEDFSHSYFISVEVESISIKFYYREIGEIIDELEEEYLKINLKGFLCINIPSSRTRYEFSLLSQNQIRYNLKSRKNYILKIPIYSNIDIKIKFNENIYQPTLGISSNNDKLYSNFYTWTTYSQSTNNGNVKYKIYYYSTELPYNRLYFTIASFCFYEKLDDKNCNIGFFKHKFSSSSIYKIPISISLSLKSNKNYYLQIIFRIVTDLSLNPTLHIIDSIIDKRIVLSKSSFRFCKNIHCFVIIRESNIEYFQRHSLIIRVDRNTGFCFYTIDSCFENSNKYLKSPRKHGNIYLNFIGKYKHLIFFMLKQHLSMPIILQLKDKGTIYRDKYKHKKGENKFIFNRYIHKNQREEKNQREDENFDESCNESSLYKKYRAFYITSIIFFTSGSIIIIPFIYVLLNVFIKRRMIYRKRDFNRASKYFRETC